MRYSSLRASVPDLVTFAGLVDIYWTCERTSDISPDITYYYSLLLFPFLMHFVGFRLSYIFPQCQPLHYGYTPGNVYLFIRAVRGQENISFCSILLLSII